MTVMALLSGLVILSSVCVASDNVYKKRTFDVCYEPIESISERPHTISSFSNTCTRLGRFTEGESRYHRLNVALEGLNSALQRGGASSSTESALEFRNVRVRISAGPDIVIFIDQSGAGLFGSKQFYLTSDEMAKIERVLGGIYDSIEDQKEDEAKQRQKRSKKLPSPSQR